MLIAAVYRAPLKPHRGAPPPGVHVMLAQRADLEPFLDRPDYGLQRAFVDAAFARNDACVATFVDGELAAYGWVSYAAAPHTHEVWVRVGAGHRYNYKSLTLPRYRGRHLRGSFGVLAARDAAEGVTHTLAFIERGNLASERAEQRSGGVRVGQAGFARPFGRLLAFRTPGARRFGFEFVAAPHDPAQA
jgi:hypothetical protein